MSAARITWMIAASIFACYGKSFAQDVVPNCVTLYMDSSQTPENLPPQSQQPRLNQIWCYENRQLNDNLAVLVYNFDTGKIRPEMSELIEHDSTGKITRITHGSLLKGDISFHTLNNSLINPLPAPLTYKDALKLGTNSVINFKVEDIERIDGIFDLLAKHSISTNEGYRIQLEEGIHESYLPESSMPYGAYWWPHSGLPLAAGRYSPLGKFDAAVAARTGVNPASAEWEKQYHSLTNVPWGGHCNGWSASSVLYKEVAGPKWDPETRTVFFTSDFNGIYAEASFCVDWAFYGKRYNSDADDIKDISPDKFHKVLTYYIEQLKKPVAYDYVAASSVDNHVVTGFKFEITKGLRWNSYEVKASIREHGYDGRDELINSASYFTHEFHYILYTDSNSQIVGGKWISENPDFLWVPLSQKACGRENPRINTGFADQFAATFPDAFIKTVATPTTNFHGRLLPGQVVELPISDFKGHVSSIIFPDLSIPENVLLVIDYHPTYPVAGDERRVLELTGSDLAQIQAYDINAEFIESISLKNDGEVPQEVSFRIEKVTILGGD